MGCGGNIDFKSVKLAPVTGSILVCHSEDAMDMNVFHLVLVCLCLLNGSRML